MQTMIFMRHQMVLLVKQPNVLILATGGSLLLVFVFGQAFTAIFSATGSPLSARDYFGVTLYTLALFQGAYIALWGVTKESSSNTQTRLRIAPVSPTAVLVGTFLGAWSVLVVFGLIVLAMNVVFLSVEYRTPIGTLILLVATLTFLAASLGISLATVFQRERTATALLNAAVPLLVFLGGGYTMIPDEGPLNAAARVSPIRWVNLALLHAPSAGPNEYVGPAVLFCVSLSLLLLGLAAVCVGRRS